MPAVPRITSGSALAFASGTPKSATPFTVARVRSPDSCAMAEETLLPSASRSEALTVVSTITVFPASSRTRITGAVAMARRERAPSALVSICSLAGAPGVRVNWAAAGAVMLTPFDTAV